MRADAAASASRRAVWMEVLTLRNSSANKSVADVVYTFEPAQESPADSQTSGVGV